MCFYLHVLNSLGVGTGVNEVRASQLAQASERGWFSNTSFTAGLKNLANVSTRCSGLLQGDDMLAQALIIFIA